MPKLKVGRIYNLEYEFRGSEEMIKKLRSLEDAPDEILQEVTSVALEEVIIECPVDTGLLRKNWMPQGGSTLTYVKRQPIKSNGAYRTITLYNDTPYAWVVEFGDDGRYAPHYSISNSLFVVEQQIPDIVRSFRFGKILEYRGS